MEDDKWNKIYELSCYLKISGIYFYQFFFFHVSLSKCRKEFSVSFLTFCIDIVERFKPSSQDKFKVCTISNCLIEGILKEENHKFDLIRVC